MNDAAGWEEVKRSLPVGSMVSGVVTKHAPFGVFIKISDVPFDGLIQITDFKDAGRMTPVEFPAIGSILRAVVLGFKETGRQIWLGVRPSQLASLEKTNQGSQGRRIMPVGLRLRPDRGLEFFGIEEINSLLKQGARVVELEPSEGILKKGSETEEKTRPQLDSFSVNVVVEPARE
jgi:hypothetical protein